MENPRIKHPSNAHIQQWIGEAAQLPEGAPVDVREEPHCPDPACPLRRTVFEWTDTGGGLRRAVIVKPLAYVRQVDVEKAVRRGPLPG
jgi:hypothetical protein